MDADPLGKASIGLGKPTSSTPLGATVHVLSDGTADVTGVDVQAAPDADAAGRSVAEARRLRRLDAGERDLLVPVAADAHSRRPHVRVDEAAQHRRGVRRGRRVGPHPRAPHDRNDPDAPASPNECQTGVGGKKVCDLDIVGHVDHVPGMVQVLASYVTNRRAPNLDAKFEIDTLANPALFPKIGAVHTTVLDDAAPAYVGNGVEDPDT